MRIAKKIGVERHKHQAARFALAARVRERHAAAQQARIVRQIGFDARVGAANV